MKVAVVTTSYPRRAGDAAGNFVAQGVEQLRARGTEVAVVSPAAVRHYGIAYGAGIVGNLRAQPWRAPALPLFLAGLRRAAVRAAREADIVHAHWLPSGAVAATLRVPFVLQVWGTDVELARRVPALARVVLSRARLVLAASTSLADDAHALGAREVRVVPQAVDVPATVAEPDEPPHILYAGRLSEEKGVRELAEATRGLPLVVAGDGPLRDLVATRGFLAHDELLREYERAAIVACPSHREGYGVVCAEAMAHGRAVVVTPVGGMRDLVADGVNGVVVPVGDAVALRAALERLLADAPLRGALAEAARATARERLSWDEWARAVRAAYEDARA